MAKLQVVLLPDGNMAFYSKDGTFPEGDARIRTLVAFLESQGIRFSAVGPTEQHRHDAEPAPVRLPLTQP